MNGFLKLLSLCLFLTLTVPLQAITNGVANEPDSVYLFSYSHADGSGGLKLAWSPNGNRWFSVAEGSSFVNSDFGPWGQMKRMLKPHLMQTRADDRWHCIWELTESGNSLAYVESPDLLQWKAQKYFDRSRLAEYRPAEVYPNVRKEVLLNGTVQQGWMQRVPYATVQRVISFAEHKKYRQALHAERTEQDPVRFAGLKPVEATIEVETECAKPISKHLIGIFFEDINYAADGGLYAELVQNRDFEYSSKDGSHQGWDGTYAWAVKEGNTSAAVTIAAADPIHPNNPHYAVLEARPGVTLQNDGFDGISLKKGEKYDFSLFARVAPGSKGGKVVVCLLDQTGREIARSSVNVSSKEWKKQQTVLTANADVRAAVLSLQPQTVGTLHLDMISLFPQNTFKGHKNGLRADLAQTLADRLAEATAEVLHMEVRRSLWGYAPDENLSVAELLREDFQGIRPAVGYPSMPDTSVNFIIDRLINLKQIGIRLTESGAMKPHASVSGLMFAHPKAHYFELGRIGEDQLRDYAHRRGLPVELIRRFLK